MAKEIKNKLQYKNKSYDLDDVKLTEQSLIAIQEVYCNLAARYLWLLQQASDGAVKVDRSLKELLTLLRKDIKKMYRNIDDNYSFVKTEQTNA